VIDLARQHIDLPAKGRIALELRPKLLDIALHRRAEHRVNDREPSIGLGNQQFRNLPPRL